jgi:hypothetical protein
MTTETHNNHYELLCYIFWSGRYIRFREFQKINEELCYLIKKIIAVREGIMQNET